MNASLRQAELRDVRALGEYMLRTCEFTWEKKSVRDVLWQAQQGRCYCCDRPMTHITDDPRGGARCTLDHVFPKAGGGWDALGNLALMRERCNVAKGNRPPNKRMIASLVRINAILGWPNRHT